MSETKREPYPGLADYQSIKRVTAGEITEIVAAGCYVKTASGDSVLLHFQPDMTARYQPKVGDFWVVYDDRYQSISPRKPFLAAYVPLASSAPRVDQIPTIGRIVIYTLTDQDAEAINRRRTTGPEIAARIAAIPREWPLGAQAHIGNSVEQGMSFPMVIVRTWGSDPSSAVQGQVMLDGNDTYWATSRVCGEHAGMRSKSVV